jgi:UDP-glucose 4-epimerase
MENRALAQFKHCHIYRPASVFGAFKSGHRMGLITTLMVNAYRHQTTKVWGAPATLRDYVSATDIGQFITDAVMCNSKGNPTTHILASGKPTSTQDIVHLIQAITQKKVYLQFVNATNSADITFATSSQCSPHWQPENLETRVRQIHHRLLGS